MATFNKENELSLLIGAAVVASRFVKISASNTVIHSTAGTDTIVGVTTETVASGGAVNVQHTGKVLIEASAAISVGAKLTATTAGKAVATTTAGNTVRAIALTAASSAGDIIEALLVDQVVAA